jgi:hypothetical protein
MGDYLIASAQWIQFRDSNYLWYHSMIYDCTKYMDGDIIHRGTCHHRDHERSGFLLFRQNICSDVSLKS